MGTTGLGLLTIGLTDPLASQLPFMSVSTTSSSRPSQLLSIPATTTSVITKSSTAPPLQPSLKEVCTPSASQIRVSSLPACRSLLVTLRAAAAANTAPNTTPPTSRATISRFIFYLLLVSSAVGRSRDRSAVRYGHHLPSVV